MTAKTDRELLELAARAAGITLTPVEVKNVEFQGDDRWIGYMTDPSQWARGWFDPLTDDGDALRLSVRLGIAVSQHPHGSSACAGEIDCTELFQDRSLPTETICESTRRAIVRAAAAIGETL